MNHKKSLVLLALLGSSLHALAMPIDWDPFVVCTKDFVPVSRPGGKFETVVAERVVTTCVMTTKPSLINSEPKVTPVPDRVRGSVVDLPCDKVPDKVKELKDKKAEFDTRVKNLDAEIKNAEGALLVLDNTSNGLRPEVRLQNTRCTTATNAFNQAVNTIAAPEIAACRQLPRADRADCIEEAKANAGLATGNKFTAKIAACNRSDDLKAKLAESDGLARKLRSEMANWMDVRREANIQSIKLERQIKMLEKNRPDCVNP
jgi:hypothetical protein